MTEPVKCPDCDGNGELSGLVGQTHQGNVSVEVWECTRCSGTGTDNTRFADAESFQIESDPELFPTLHRPTVRAAIDAAIESNL